MRSHGSTGSRPSTVARTSSSSPQQPCREVGRASGSRTERSYPRVAPAAAIPEAPRHRRPSNLWKNAVPLQNGRCFRNGENARGRPAESRKWRTPNPEQPPPAIARFFLAPASCVFRSLRGRGTPGDPIPRASPPRTIPRHECDPATQRPCAASGSPTQGTDRQSAASGRLPPTTALPRLVPAPAILISQM